MFKLFNKYEAKYGATRDQKRNAQLASQTGKRKHAWGRIFGGPRGSGVVGPSPATTPSLSASAASCELSAYLDSDNVTAYEEDFDLLLWWRDHKLTFSVLSIMARDIMFVPVSTVSSESCFSLTGRIIEERRRCLLPAHVEMLACIKDWELRERRLQHNVDNPEVEESFKNLYLDEMQLGLLLLAHLHLHLHMWLLLLALSVFVRVVRDLRVISHYLYLYLGCVNL
jgi:hypothetical protein